jgi:membrane-associated phospholipid phosphatase
MATATGDGPGGSGPPPAGLTEPPPDPGAPRTGLGAGLAVVLVLAAAAGLWAALTGVGPARLDAAVLSGSVDARSGVLTAIAVLLTDIGSTVAMALLAVAAGTACWHRGRRADAVLVVGAMAGAAVVFRGLKLLLDRPRPPSADRLVDAAHESLPSGHATMSVVVIGSLVVLTGAGRGGMARVAAPVVAALWVGAVGATRVYLGVHWFSDVLAGWLVGAAWLSVCVAAWSRWCSREPARTALSNDRSARTCRSRG